MAGSRSLLALLALAGTANAQPITQPDRECRVVVALAPDDVRAEIEAWVRAEPRCLRELEVRVVPAEDGLYLSATDIRGHVRERVVPDAQSAAVLIVSWMADDSLGPRLPARAALDAPPAAAPIDADDSEIPGEVMTPGLVRSMQRRDAGRRWLTLGAVGYAHEEIGFRAQIDLFAGRVWSLGIAGGWRDEDHHGDAGQARVVIGASHSLGRISLRAQLGLGVDITASSDRMARDTMSSAHDNHARVLPAIEAGVLAKVRITDAWGVVGGPIVAATPETHPSLSVFLGVQYGL